MNNQKNSQSNTNFKNQNQNQNQNNQNSQQKNQQNKTNSILKKDIVPFTILYFHSSGEDLGIIHPQLQFLSETLHCDILTWDYPGYGINLAQNTEKILKIIQNMYINIYLEYYKDQQKKH